MVGNHETSKLCINILYIILQYLCREPSLLTLLCFAWRNHFLLRARNTTGQYIEDRGTTSSMIPYCQHHPALQQYWMYSSYLLAKDCHCLSATMVCQFTAACSFRYQENAPASVLSSHQPLSVFTRYARHTSYIEQVASNIRIHSQELQYSLLPNLLTITWMQRWSC